MYNVLYIVKSNSNKGVVSEELYLPPLGVLSIANVLRLHGYNVKVIDMSVELINIDDIIRIIAELNPLFIGFSTYTENIDNIFSMCKFIKKSFRNIPIVIGGAHPTVAPEYCKRKQLIDFIIEGEGEQNSIELAEAIRTKQKIIKYSDIHGLIYLDEKKKYQNGAPKRFIENLDLIPIVNRDYLKQSFKSVLPTIYSSKGCPGRCIYCAASSLSGSKHRIRDIDNVFLETIYLTSLCPNYTQVFYCDDTFTVYRARLERFIQLCDGMEKNFSWRCESRVDAMWLNSDLLPALNRIGCKRIQYGIESGNQIVLNKIRKGLNLEHANIVIDKTVNAGINVAASFMLGHFCDTIDTMHDTINLMKSLTTKYPGKVGVAFGVNTPFPGTYQYDHMDELGISLQIKSYADMTMETPIAYTKNFSIDDLNKLSAEANLYTVMNV